MFTHGNSFLQNFCCSYLNFPQSAEEISENQDMFSFKFVKVKHCKINLNCTYYKFIVSAHKKNRVCKVNGNCLERKNINNLWNNHSTYGCMFLIKLRHDILYFDKLCTII